MLFEISRNISDSYHKYLSNGWQDNFEENDLVCNKSTLVWVKCGEIFVFKG